MKRLASSLAGFAIGVVLVSAAFANDHKLVLPQQANDPVTLAIPEGFATEPSEVLQVFVGPAERCCEDRTPVAGRYTLENTLLSFTPAFGFNAGTSYIARVKAAESAELTSFSIASDNPVAHAAVTRIYPSSDVLPENTLRFYIHFSVPMTPGVAFDYIKLRDASGTSDEAAFMQFKQELWNDDRTRLTVLIDPGRIKRKVATNMELGPALIAGNRYSLSVDGGWPTVNGQSELAPFSKTFRVSAPLRKRPDVRLWQTTSPCIGTDEVLEIRFDRPFDRHRLEKDIRVFTRDGNVVSGNIEIGAGEQSWRFTPKEPWSIEEIQVTTNSELEDIAANNFRDLLDHLREDEAVEAATTVRRIRLKSCH